MQLAGKVAIVTGAGRGIGYAISKRYLMDGATVVLSDIDGSAADRAAEDLEQYGQVRAMTVDVANKLDIHNLVTYTTTNFGKVDILVNNAGIIHQADFLSLKEDEFDRIMRTNLKGTFLCGQAVAKRMISQIEEGLDPGVIINMSSANAIFGMPEQIAYAISKAGINQLTRMMATTLAPWRIRVNAIGPGSVETGMLDEIRKGTEISFARNTPPSTKRIGQPDEVASIASFLASRDANYINGQTIYADGGFPL